MTSVTKRNILDLMGEAMGCSSCRTNALHARLAVVIELQQLSNTQSLTALLSISFRHYFLNIKLISVLS